MTNLRNLNEFEALPILVLNLLPIGRFHPAEMSQLGLSDSCLNTSCLILHSRLKMSLHSATERAELWL